MGVITKPSRVQRSVIVWLLGSCSRGWRCPSPSRPLAGQYTADTASCPGHRTRGCCPREGITNGGSPPRPAVRERLLCPPQLSRGQPRPGGERLECAPRNLRVHTDRPPLCGKPQSVPAMPLSRLTSRVEFLRRKATNAERRRSSQSRG